MLWHNLPRPHVTVATVAALHTQLHKRRDNKDPHHCRDHHYRSHHGRDHSGGLITRATSM